MKGGAVSTGSTEITAPSLFVMLQANGDAAIIEGNAKINANRISMQSANNAAIAGDADLQAQNDITLLGGTLQTQNDIVKYSDVGEMGTDNGNRRDI